MGEQVGGGEREREEGGEEKGGGGERERLTYLDVLLGVLESGRK